MHHREVPEPHVHVQRVEQLPSVSASHGKARSPTELLLQMHLGQKVPYQHETLHIKMDDRCTCCLKPIPSMEN